MKARVEKVSPSLARKWLERSEGFQQRGIRKKRVEKLVHAILSDQWQVTHQGIAINEDGVVIDGQHRLHAIIQADQTVEMLIMRGVSTDVFHSIDTGASRTPSDSLKIAGFSDTNVLAAVVRSILVYDQVVGTTANEWATLDRRTTTSDILDYLDDPDRKEQAVNACKVGRMIAGNVSRFGSTTPIAAVQLILNTHPTDIGPDTAAEFNARLMDGVLLGPRSPILALRRWLVSDTGYVNVSGSIRRPVTIAVIIKAMNDYALGIERSLSIFRYGKEIIPAPLPVGAREKYLQEVDDDHNAAENGSPQDAAKATAKKSTRKSA